MTNPQEANLLYPKSGPLFLLAEVQRLTANVADLIDACVRKDQQIAVLEGELAQHRPENVVQLEAKG